MLKQIEMPKVMGWEMDKELDAEPLSLLSQPNHGDSAEAGILPSSS